MLRGCVLLASLAAGAAVPAPAIGQSSIVGDLSTVAQICRGGVGQLFETDRGTIVFSNETVQVNGERIFMSDEAGPFTQEVKIDFDTYTECIVELGTTFLGMATTE